MSRAAVIWAGIVVALAVPVALAAFSPFLAWRSWIYIVAGFAGILAATGLVLQPLLAARMLPAMTPRMARRGHRALGLAILALILLHLGGLWITSPPDVVDALLFVSPTPFSAWGVLAMWAAILAGCIAVFRAGLRLKARRFRLLHMGLSGIVVLGTVLHALLIEGAMEPLSKAALCLAMVLAYCLGLAQLRRLTKK